tara:strand:+ start:7667 stop:8152 length:486 start_codon:yes stop_codon:yes gene_type:complete
VLFVLGIVLVLLAFGYWYKLTYSMEVAENSGINSPQLATKILIATQGSDFKDAIVTNLINFYKKDSVHLKTIDVTQLRQVKPNEYNAIILLHTWEYGKPPRIVSQFINENSALKNKMIVYATSGAGNNKIEGIDAMAGESILENASDVSDEVIEKIESILK